jgi:hypothetical protein
MRKRTLLSANNVRIYTQAILACGSMVLFFFCRSFFAQLGEKRPAKSNKPVD